MRPAIGLSVSRPELDPEGEDDRELRQIERERRSNKIYRVNGALSALGILALAFGNREFEGVAPVLIFALALFVPMEHRARLKRASERDRRARELQDDPQA